MRAPTQRRHAAIGAWLIDNAVAARGFDKSAGIGGLFHLEGIEAGADQEVELIAQHIPGGAQRAAKTIGLA